MASPRVASRSGAAGLRARGARFAMNSVVGVKKPEPVLLEHFNEFLAGPAEFIFDCFDSRLLRGCKPGEITFDAYVRPENHFNFLERTEEITDESRARGIGHRPERLETFEKRTPVQPFMIEELGESDIQVARDAHLNR